MPTDSLAPGRTASTVSARSAGTSAPPRSDHRASAAGRPAQSASPAPAERTFPCTACGACCRNLGGAPLYARLDRGDGVCRHLDTGTDRCRIYETRPRICRVADMYEAFADRLAWPEYVEHNLRACRDLQARERRAASNRGRDACSSSI